MYANEAIVDGVVEMVSGVPGGGIDFVYVGRILLILLGMYLLSSGLTVVQGFLMTGVSQKCRITCGGRSPGKSTACL